MILAGDVGGTKTRLALFDTAGGQLKRTVVERFDSKSVQRFQDLVSSFLEKHKAKVSGACFGIPGPVIERKAKTTNLPWLLSEPELEKDTGIPKVRLVNDLLATAAAIPRFQPQDLEVIHPGKDGGTGDMAVVVAPGTGLGQAFIHFGPERATPSPSEGGHADFAPNTELESKLFLYLKKKFGHVSYERVLCGSGAVNIYNFLKDNNVAPESPEVAKRFSQEDPAAVIAQNALAGTDPLCEQTLNLFCSMLGAQAGNLVLTLLATKGVYLGGGIPPKILPKIKEEHFLKAYLEKGRLSDVVKVTPVYVIKDDHAAVLGAAQIASEL